MYIIDKDLEKNRISKAYILIGDLNLCFDKSIEIALRLNCTNKIGNDFCGTCSYCRRIKNSNHPDIFFIKASGKGHFIKIEQIHELQSSIEVEPLELPKRICIVEGVEYLDIEAANSFLKTLEEPPSHTLFILTCSNLYGVIDTISSRCRRVFLKNDLDFNINNYSGFDEYSLELRNIIIDILAKKIADEKVLDILEDIQKKIKNKSKTKEYFNIILTIIELFLRDIVFVKESGVEEKSLFNKDKLDIIDSIATYYSFDKIDELLNKILELKGLLDFNPNFKIALANILL